MSLRLRMLKGPKGIAFTKTEHIFSQHGGTLGRAETNSWPLLDPDKFLSSCHCEISFNNNEVLLLDRSTNGTFINESNEPIGRGNTVSLGENDLIDIGDYQFLVKLEIDNFISITPSSSPFEVISNDINSSYDFAPEDSSDGFSSALPTSYFSQEMDPLALWEKNSPSNRFSHTQNNDSLFKEPSPTPALDTINSLDNYLKLSVSTSPYDYSTSIDQGASINQAITWPNISHENVIPENWDDELLTTNNTKNILQNEVENKSSNKVNAEVISHKNNQLVIDPIEPKIITNASDVLNSKKYNQSSINPINNLCENDNENIQYSPLINALGLDKSRLNEEDITEIEELSGHILREVVDGLLNVLRSRSSIKNEFRMNVTTIQPVENNPLKFSVNVDDALENIFLKKSNAFKKPIQAFREGFQEISEHQLAMIAGIREGFEAMLNHFDPNQLESMFNKNKKHGFVSLIHKNKPWNNYLDYYKKLNEDIDLSFQQLFGSNFSSAYENQLKRVSTLSKKEI